TDRPPPLYTDGVDGFDEPGPGLTPLCPDVPDPVTGGIDHMIPWWASAGQDTDGTNLYTVECRRGVRVHYGPWQVGTDPKIYDRVAEAIVRFENIDQLNDDNVPLSNRREWNVASEFYNHFGSHHGTCWNPGVGFQGTGQLQGPNPCNNPDDPATAASTHHRGTNGIPPPDGSYKPISVGFDVVVNVATTFFPPYTIGNTGSVWYAPYDLAIGILAIHSHKRTVKGTIDVMPANPIRTGGLSQEEAGAGVRP